MNRIITFLAALLLITCLPAYGQNLISVEYLESASQAELEQELNIDATNGVDFYAVTYLTNGSDGLPDTASGLFVIPDNGLSVYPAVIYHHGTSSARDLAPSNLNLEYDAYTGLGASGYATVAPDYLGMGTSRGFHPYVHRETQASASVDLFKAFQEWVESQDFDWSGHLFLTGYSQGGHASMATHWELERNPSHGLEVSAASHLSGPYSISQVMLNNMLAEEDYFFVSYIPFVLLGYQEVYGNLFDDLSEILRPAFADDAMDFYNGNINLVQLNLRMLINMGSTFFNVHPVNIFQPEFVDSVRNNPDYFISEILRENDTYDWAPNAPTRLMYCRADDQVPFMNSVIADSVMNANGAPDVASIDINSSFNHGQCARPALLETINFFNSLLVDTNVDEEPLAGRNFKISPNPAGNHFSIAGLEEEVSVETTVLDRAGKPVLRTNGNSSVDISSLNPGLYIVRVSTSDKVYSQILTIAR
jgi:hypothetical protein